MFYIKFIWELLAPPHGLLIFGNQSGPQTLRIQFCSNDSERVELLVEEIGRFLPNFARVGKNMGVRYRQKYEVCRKELNRVEG